MPLSMNQPIQQRDIRCLRVFKENAVYLLVGHNNDEIVIKWDRPNPNMVKAANIGAKAIDPTSRMKVLQPNELEALRGFVNAGLHWDRNQRGQLRTPEELRILASIRDMLNYNGNTFTKMARKDMHTVEEAVAHRDHGDTTWVDGFRKSLKNPGGLERLGQVVAGDVFNGNADRFFPYTFLGTDRPPAHNVGGVLLSLLTVHNIGNVILVGADRNQMVPAMLDCVDPYNEYWNYEKPLVAIEGMCAYRWPGRVLGQPDAMRTFADEIIADLKALLCPDLPKFRFGHAKDFGAHPARRLVQGMHQGVNLLRLRLEQKFNVPNHGPQGARDRYEVLRGIHAV